VPILVERYLTKTKTIEHSEGGRIIHRMKPTYAEIAECVKLRHGFVPKTCWIAHVKELNGLPVRVAHPAQGDIGLAVASLSGSSRTSAKLLGVLFIDSLSQTVLWLDLRNWF